MYFSQSSYHQRDAHLFNALAIVYNTASTVPCLAEIQTVNNRFIMIRMNDGDQKDSDYVHRTIKQRKIERFMDRLNDAMSLPRNVSKDKRGEKTIICEPKDFIAALYVVSDDFNLEKDSKIKMHNAIREANQLTRHINASHGQQPRVFMH